MTSGGQTLKHSTESGCEVARLRALAQYHLMDTPPNEAFDRLTILAARLFSVPVAFVSLIDEKRQFFKSRYGLQITETSRSVAFCHHTLESDDILCVPNALDDPRFANSPLVQGYPFIRFYAGVPLITPDGHRIGTLCLTDNHPRPAMSTTDRQNLTDLAALVMDRMEVHRIEVLRHASQQRLEAISITSPDAIICTDLNRGITFWNPAATNMFGYDAEEMAGKYVAGLIPERCQTDYRNELERLEHEEAAISAPRTLQIWGKRCNGEEFPAEVSFSGWREGIERYIGMIIRDVTLRYESEARLCELASLDMLTRLASRSAFMTQLSKLTESGVPYTLLMTDLDSFKDVNDTRGHAAGDALLCHVAEQIRAVCTQAIAAARLGGDEFIVLLPCGSDEAMKIAQQLTAAIQTPFHYMDSTIAVGASTGVASFPHHATDTSSVMSAADLALYRAKASGKGQSVLFKSEFREAELGRRRFERELEAAVRQQQFVLHYQPRFDAQNGELIGCEALVRWMHPARGLLFPADFIDMLIKSPLSITLGTWIVQSAVSQVKQWRAQNLSLRVSINLFPRQLMEAGLEEVIRQCAGDDAGFIDLEVDEPLLTNTVDIKSQVLEAIQATGALLIVDHFGRSLASMSLLQHRCVAGLKIDKSLTLQLEKSNKTRLLINTIASLAKNMGITVAAEGIENDAQHALICAAECDVLQGNQTASPVSAPRFEQLYLTPLN